MAEKIRVVVIGGGAAGYFAAIACAEKLGDRGTVTLYEATAHPLAKVRVSGGGRCNVTHACFEPRELVKKYPRGGRELLGRSPAGSRAIPPRGLPSAGSRRRRRRMAACFR
jgi:predicted flavoprotein YhiN